MELLTTEGLVLQIFPYRDHDAIASLFTAHEGILKLYVKGAFSPKKNKGGVALAPLNLMEVTYSKGRSELYVCSSLITISTHLNLRHSFATLESALQLLHTIIITQQPGKAAPELYALLLAYLKKLPQAPYPSAATASFRLKTLGYEGLFRSSSCCSSCQQPLDSRYFFHGEAFCSRHAPCGAFFFSAEESLMTDLLLLSRDFSQITSIPIEAALTEKIALFFTSCCKL